MGGTWSSALRRSTATRLTPTARLACRVHLAAPDQAGAPGRPPSSKGTGAVSCQWSSPLKPVAPRRRRLCSALPSQGQRFHVRLRFVPRCLGGMDRPTVSTCGFF